VVAHFGELNADKGAHEELDHNLTGLVPVTPKAAWEGLNIYEILIGRLMRLERALVANGFEDPVPRIQFHLGVLRALQVHHRIDSDETLWSLVEATELADILLQPPPDELENVPREVPGGFKGANRLDSSGGGAVC
jgi:hypothetical protein